MSKYETTSAQYCQFLNEALASGDITVNGDRVYGANGSNSGEDFVDQLYFYISSYSQIKWNGTSFSVLRRNGYDMSNHPVGEVSLYGATAFCNYYGFRLPTEWEWQAVADFDGRFEYGCEMTISHSKANYDKDNPLGLTDYPWTTPVDYYPSYGYGMNDMAGNVWEWTTSLWEGGHIIRGGGWYSPDDDCTVWSWMYLHPGISYSDIGFRACRNDEIISVPNVVNLAQAEAEAAIVDAGLTVGMISRTYSDTINAGNVISQNPAAGELLPPRGVVDLVISLGPMLEHMVWVYIDDPGVEGHEGFKGEMSKYETTNVQYCHFLNEALSSGDITIGSNNIVYGASGSNDGEDFVGKIYFETCEAEYSSQITYSNGIFSVRSRDGYDMSDYPVTEVSWYGATAFCNYYGYRLPTEWEWQAVADYDGSYIYGCGTTIDHSKANYDRDNPLGLSTGPYTSPVDYYSSYGYGMNDMAGNVWEWTSTTHLGLSYLCSGSFFSSGDDCAVSRRNNILQSNTWSDMGFRVCR
jgi:formylglycine-generating enzyme required for sulfatase activity